jgi:hypothetical protein
VLLKKEHERPFPPVLRNMKTKQTSIQFELSSLEVKHGAISNRKASERSSRKNPELIKLFAVVLLAGIGIAAAQNSTPSD